MARRRISETCELARQIMDGEHDADLGWILQAAQARTKNMFRVGSKVEITDGPDTGKTATILRVSAKTITIGVGEAIVHDAGTAWAYTEYTGREWRYPPSHLKPYVPAVHGGLTQVSLADVLAGEV